VEIHPRGPSGTADEKRLGYGINGKEKFRKKSGFIAVVKNIFRGSFRVILSFLHTLAVLKAYIYRKTIDALVTTPMENSQWMGLRVKRVLQSKEI
jgi:hypothetical protein